MSEKIAAVVVTYNRKELLQECLDRLLNQTRELDSIIIVDNASTDGTFKALEKGDYLHKEIIDYNKLDENIGSSGGFHYGMQRGLKKGFDAVWVMDDDGKPNFNCLEELLSVKAETGAHYIGSLVVRKGNKEQLCFRLINEKKEKINYIDDILDKNRKKGYIVGDANPFNGVLFTKELMNDIGFPKKDMFIWGDEVEYHFRAKSYGYKVVTSINAIHEHPKPKSNAERIMLGHTSVSFANNKLRDYCYFRNRIYSIKKYKSKISFLKFMTKHIWYFLFNRKFDFKNLVLYFSAIFDGLKEDFSNHRKYL